MELRLENSVGGFGVRGLRDLDDSVRYVCVQNIFA